MLEMERFNIIKGGKMKFVLIMFSLYLLLILSSCSEKKSSPTEPNNTEISFTNDIQPIFNNNCIGCHAHGGLPEAQILHLISGVSYNNLVNHKSAQDSTFTRVVPGDADNSLLMQKLKGIATVGVNPVMPPTGQINSDLIDKVETWIKDGAKNN